MKKASCCFFSYLLLACFLLTSGVYAKESTSYVDWGDSTCQSEELSKIYVTPDQILITPDGISVYTKNRDRLLKGELIAIENGRVYVAVSKNEMTNISPTMRGPCRIHRIVHPVCQGCGVLLCPGNCTCYD